MSVCVEERVRLCSRNAGTCSPARVGSGFFRPGETPGVGPRARSAGKNGGGGPRVAGGPPPSDYPPALRVSSRAGRGLVESSTSSWRVRLLTLAERLRVGSCRRSSGGTPPRPHGRVSSTDT